MDAVTCLGNIDKGHKEKDNSADGIQYSNVIILFLKKLRSVKTRTIINYLRN